MILYYSHFNAISRNSKAMHSIIRQNMKSWPVNSILVMLHHFVDCIRVRNWRPTHSFLPSNASTSLMDRPKFKAVLRSYKGSSIVEALRSLHVN